MQPNILTIQASGFRRTGKATMSALVIRLAEELAHRGGYIVRRRGSNGCEVTAGWLVDFGTFAIARVQCANTNAAIRKACLICREHITSTYNPPAEQQPVTLNPMIQFGGDNA